MLIERLYPGINETKQCELELLVACLHNPYSLRMWRNTPNANTFHAVDVRTLLRYFNTIVL